MAKPDCAISDIEGAATPDRRGREEPASTRRPRVVVVGHYVAESVFGAERSLLDLLAAVDRRRYDLSCVLPNSDDAYLRAVAQHTQDITVFSYQWWSAERPADPEAVARFEALFRQKRVDLVHVNTMTLLDPLLAARRLRVPGILHARELIDQDHELAERFGGDVAAILKRVEAATDFVIANSEATRLLYGRGNETFRLYNSVDLERFDLQNDLEPGKLKIGLISSNSQKKGIDNFVDIARMASRRRPELEFHAIGPRTPQVDRLERQIRDGAALGNLRFRGYMADPVDALRQVDVVVSLSLVPESFGRTIAEAMAARRPVIAYRWGAMPELIHHDWNGFLVSPLDLPGMLEHLGTLSDRPDLVAEMGQRGRRLVSERFSGDVFAAELNAIYGRILESWRARGQDRG